MDVDRVLAGLAEGDHAESLVHVEHIPAREAPDAGPLDIAPELSVRLRRAGIERLWSHQADGLRAARASRNVAVATGTASGKSLVYQLATFERLLVNAPATSRYPFPSKPL